MKRNHLKILCVIKMFSFLFVICFLSAASIAATFKIVDPGTEQVVDYDKYGDFKGLGTGNCVYKINDYKGLQQAVGAGIYPNTDSIFKEPDYKAKEAAGALEGSQWDFVNTDNYQLNFYKWATVNENPGVKLFFTARALEKAGHIHHALKAYYAIVVHFPKSSGVTYWGTPWYVGPVALGRINYILYGNPLLGLKLFDAKISMSNQYDDSIKNDVYNEINPGMFVRIKTFITDENASFDSAELTIDKKIGKSNVKLVRYSNNHWQMLVNGKPFVIRGMNYFPTKVGASPDYSESTETSCNVLRGWMNEDSNSNGIIDAPYESWVDENGNNIQDADEKTVGDFQLMKDMGVNTIRFCDHEGLNKDLLMDGHKKYGFMCLIGDLLGMYAVGSGADKLEGTDYTNPEHRKRMLQRVKKMVKEYKDEPYVLMWVLGNENNYGILGKKDGSVGLGCSKTDPKVYYKFVDKVAKTIKSLDPQKRPVAICNGDTLFLNFAAKAKNVDVFGVNSYRGEEGFGSLWQDVKSIYNKPVLITEYGCSAYHSRWDLKRAEDGQAKYHMGNWLNIKRNMAGSGHGNALGGCVFEWVDEWWKAGHKTDSKVHDTSPQFGMPFLDGNSYEEWLGICTQGDGSKSPFLRQLRPIYYIYKRMWESRVVSSD